MFRSVVFAARYNLARPASRQFSTSGKLSGRALVVADQAGGELVPSSLNAIAAASKVSSDGVTVLVTGASVDGAVKTLSGTAGVSRILVASSDRFANPVSEDVAAVVHSVQKKENFTHILGPASAAGKSTLPRLAAQLDVSQISEIIEVKSDDVFVRPIYAGNALATVESKDPVKVITVRSTSFDAPGEQDASKAAVENIDIPELPKTTEFVSKDVQKSERPDLGSASIVISGGRAMKNGDNFKILYDLADTVGGAVGASRAAVDAGYCPNDMQVGQTGKVVAPNLYIAAGISGAIQHLAGMKDSKTIVAINSDAEAPIFQVADLGLVSDLFTAVPELTEKIKAGK